MSNDTAVCLMSFNRPKYLKKTVESLESVVDKDQVDWHLMQDGAVNKFSRKRRANTQTIQNCIDILKDANLPNKTIDVNNYNLCSALQMKKTMEKLDNYDTVIHVEDDMLVSKYLLRIANSLIDEYPNCVPGLYREMDVSKVDVDKCINDVFYYTEEGSFAVFPMTTDIYDEIRDDMEKFYNIIENTDWWVGERPLDELSEKYPDLDVYAWDGVLGHILTKNGICRVVPRISRSSHIGKHGLNVTPSFYESREYGMEGELTYAYDKNAGNWHDTNSKPL